MSVPVLVSFSHHNGILVPRNSRNTWLFLLFLVKSFHKRNMIYIFYSVYVATYGLLSITERACLCQIPIFPFFLLSRGKWNCQGVAAEFQHPRAKIILLWSPRTCWSFCRCDCQMGRGQKGLGLLRCMKCGKHRENRRKERERAISH